MQRTSTNLYRNNHKKNDKIKTKNNGKNEKKSGFITQILSQGVQTSTWAKGLYGF